MSQMTKMLLSAVAALTLATAAVAAEPAKKMRTDKGEALVNPNGMTLYVFDRDSAGKSACNDQCAVNWPPFTAKASDMPSGNWSVVKRDDGSLQWAYKSRPLYTWSKDTKAGETSGDGVNGSWHIAKP